MVHKFNYPPGYADKCAAVLDTALHHVPSYRGWRASDPGPDAPLDARFAALPHLTKADMRAGFPTGLMPESMDLRAGLASEEVEYTFTSGTSADKVVNIWNQHWWDASEAASWQLNSHLAVLQYPQRQAKLASSLNVGINCEEDLPTGHRTLGDTLYLNEKTSTLQWQPRHLRRMVDELAAFRPVILEANPSLLARLAWWAIDNGAAVYSPDVIVFTFELPSPMHLAAIRRVFDSALVSSYGTTETGFVMESCEYGLLHQNTPTCRIDFEPLKDEFGGPDLGRIFVTTFGNPWNVIVRFDVGDLVRLHATSSCACGRAEGLIADAIEGRASNCTFTVAGGLVTTMALDDALAAVGALRDYRLVQSERSHYELTAVLSPDADISSVSRELKDILGVVYGATGQFDVVIVDDILPGPAGKFRRMETGFEFDERGLTR